jgi:nicotinamide-nucleotide amidase
MWSGEPGGAVAARVLESLAQRDETVATAESLTGGLLSARLTDVPGASRSFVGGAVSYATRVKVSLLDVPDDLVATFGVVSGECAVAMAQGARKALGATWAIATTGVAGPDEQEGKPVGTVWVAVAGPASGTVSRRLSLEGDRLAIRQHTCEAALELLEEQLNAREVEVMGREEGGLG